MQVDATTQPAATVLTRHGGRLADAMMHGVSQADLLSICRNTNAAAAVVLILAGVVLLLWGFYAFKAIVILNAAVLGGWIGYLIGQRSGAALPAAGVAAFVAAAIAWPMMKYAVAVMGGLIGTLLGMAIWRTAGLDPAYAAAGGGMGLIFFGLISFILFRTSVMTFTSLQGAAMLTFGAMCVLYKIKVFDAKVLDTKLMVTPLIVPVVVGLAAMLGIVYQTNDTKPTEAK